MDFSPISAAILVFVLFAQQSLFGRNLETASRDGEFKIIQRYEDKSGWSEILHFTDKEQPEVVLEAEISWPGDYYISPDDHWILRIQKTGSGDNVAYLYFLENNGSVWRMERRLDEMGFDYLGRQPKGLPSGMYHAGIEFISWDMPRHLLHFSIHASSDPGMDGVHASLAYQLLKNRIVAP